MISGLSSRSIFAVSASLALTLAAFFLIWKFHNLAIERQFELDTEEIQTHIRSKLADSLHDLQAIVAFYNASEKVTRKEFRRFSALFLANNKSLQALEWIPFVSFEEREFFEKEAERYFPHFQFTEKAPAGEMVRAGVRKEYYPVYFVEPYEGNEVALGYDLASHPVRLEALLRARDTGEAAATAAIELVQERERQKGLLVYMPFYAGGDLPSSVEERREKLQGFVVGVFHVGNFIKRSLSHVEEVRKKGLNLYVFDGTDSGGMEFLCSLSLQKEEEEIIDCINAPDMSTIRKMGHHILKELPLAGRKWSILIHQPVFTAAHDWQPWSVLLAGLIFTTLLFIDLRQRQLTNQKIQQTNVQLQKAVAELEAAKEKVIEQERLRVLGQMASGIAHDFNNSLSVILGFAELLQSKPEFLEDREKSLAYLHNISLAAEDAAHVVRRMRDFYRVGKKGEARLEQVDVNAILSEAILLSQPRWRDEALAKGVTIAVSTNLRPTPFVSGVSAELREALINLIFNSVEAMPDGGSITLKSWSEKDSVFIEVRDTGVGMTKEVLQRCWEPFFTTKGSQSTGLGLSSVRGIVHRHEGTFSMESEPGKGTSCLIRLPAYIEGAVPLEKEGKFVQKQRPLKVLLIDDEPLVYQVLEQYLLNLGHAVAGAADGMEGWKKFCQENFDLVITDRALPQMSGDDLARKIKQMSPKMPVIMITGFGELMQARGEMPSGVECVVSKPLTIEHLREAIAKVVGYGEQKSGD